MSRLTDLLGRVQLCRRWRRWFPFDTPARMAVSLLKLAGIALVLAPLAWWFAAYPLVHFYTPMTMATLSGKTQTHCMGRYLIDLPVEFGVLEGAGEFYWGLKSDFKKVQITVKSDGTYTRAAFEQAIDQRAAELQATMHRALHRPLLLLRESWPTPIGAVTLLRSIEGGLYTSDHVRSEVHMLVGDRYATAFNFSYAENILDKPSGYEAYKHINPGPEEALLKRVAVNVQGYSDATRAPEGFCFSGLVMNEKTMGYDVETGSFGASDERVPHSHFGTLIQGQFQQKTESLVQRAKRMNARMAPLAAAEGMRILDLRLSDRALDGIPGLEWVVADKYPKGVTFQMQAETHQEKAKQTMLRPSMYFTLDIGESDTDGKFSPLTEHQALQVWDGILNSLHLSPANGGRRSGPGAASEVAPTARVGGPCPRTGLWEARLPPGHRNAHALAGSGVYRFKQVTQGQPMPEMYPALMFSKAGQAANAEITWYWFGPDPITGRGA